MNKEKTIEMEAAVETKLPTVGSLSGKIAEGLETMESLVDRMYDEAVNLAVGADDNKVLRRDEDLEASPPVDPPEYTSAEIRAIRQQLDMDQEAFAAILNSTPETVEAWESGEQSPSSASLKLLYIADKNPSALIS